MNGFAFGLDMDARKRKAHQWATQEGFSDRSWWLDVEKFYENARTEQERMKRSRFGRTDMMTSARNVSATAKRESIFGEEE